MFVDEVPVHSSVRHEQSIVAPASNLPLVKSTSDIDWKRTVETMARKVEVVVVIVQVLGGRLRKVE
jgi:hypothetical protein